MNHLLIKNKILKVVCEPLYNHYKDTKKNDVYGLTFDEISNKTGLNKSILWHYGVELIHNKEIDVFDVNGKGFIAEDKGLSSLMSKKYIRLYRKELMDSVRFYFNVLIPLLSLFIAVYTIVDKNKEIEERISEKIKLIEIRVDKKDKDIELLKTKVKEFESNKKSPAVNKAQSEK